MSCPGKCANGCTVSFQTLIFNRKYFRIFEILFSFQLAWQWFRYNCTGRGRQESAYEEI